MTDNDKKNEMDIRKFNSQISLESSWLCEIFQKNKVGKEAKSQIIKELVENSRKQQ